MNAIDLLEQQHEAVSQLFKKTKKTRSALMRKQVFVEIADALAMHTTIEERIFYPAVKFSRTMEALVEAVDEHLEIKRCLVELLDLDLSEDLFASTLGKLQQLVERHVTEERTDLFPKVRNLLSIPELEHLGEQMELLMEALEGTAPRFAVRNETAHPAAL